MYSLNKKNANIIKYRKIKCLYNKNKNVYLWFLLLLLFLLTYLVTINSSMGLLWRTVESVGDNLGSKQSCDVMCAIQFDFGKFE